MNERTEFLDDPIVTYLVNGLDAVRTGRLDTTLSISLPTVNDVIDVFILATRIAESPAQFAASLVPTVADLAAGWTSGSNTILTPLSIVQTLAFAPTTYGAPILKGVMQSMCAV